LEKVITKPTFCTFVAEAILRSTETMAPPSALPIGATRVVSEMQPVQVDPAQAGSGLLNMVLAFLAPVNPDENERYDDEILDLNVIGFLVVYVTAS
jgi:polyribonucleotide 5'-hydroxyl-kinase